MPVGCETDGCDGVRVHEIVDMWRALGCRAEENLSRAFISFPRSMSSQSAAQSSDEVHSELVRKKCVPCETKDLRPMSEESANDLLQQVPGWKIEQIDGKLQLQRCWKAKTFLKGLEFFKLVGDVAEAEGHHPDLHLTGYNNVKINIWTYAAGGLTENDFVLAAKIGALDASDLFRKPKL